MHTVEAIEDALEVKERSKLGSNALEQSAAMAWKTMVRQYVSRYLQISRLALFILAPDTNVMKRR